MTFTRCHQTIHFSAVPFHSSPSRMFTVSNYCEWCLICVHLKYQYHRVLTWWWEVGNHQGNTSSGKPCSFRGTRRWRVFCNQVIYGLQNNMHFAISIWSFALVIWLTKACAFFPCLPSALVLVVFYSSEEPACVVECDAVASNHKAFTDVTCRLEMWIHFCFFLKFEGWVAGTK